MSLVKVTVEFEWDEPDMRRENRPFTKLRYEFPYPALKQALLVTGAIPADVRYTLELASPIARPVITETTETPPPDYQKSPGEISSHGAYTYDPDTGA